MAFRVTFGAAVVRRRQNTTMIQSTRVYWKRYLVDEISSRSTYRAAWLRTAGFATEQPVRSSLDHSANEAKETHMMSSNATTQIVQLCRQKDPVGAERVLRHLEQQIRQGRKDPVPPPLKLYNRVLFSYTSQNMPREAERLLKNMMRTPNCTSFNCCLTAWARANNPKRAHALLASMLKSKVTPDTKSFNIVISAYAKEENVEEATDLLQFMHQYSTQHPEVNVDRVTLTSMMKVLSAQGKAEDARAILDRMEFSSDESLRPDAYLYVHAIQALAARKREAYTLNRVAPYTGNKALDLLKFMKERYLKRKDPLIKPDIVVYNAVLNVLASVGDGDRAERMLQQMLRGEDSDGILGPEDVPLPTTVSYATVLLALRNSSRKDSAERAESLLLRMPNPNTFCYTTVISAWGRRAKPRRAEQLLEQMRRLYNENPSEDIRPNNVAYSAVLDAWASSGDPTAVPRIHDLLRRMELDGPRPNTVSYNTLIKGIEKSPVSNKANLACGVLERMRSNGVDANIRTYNSILWACSAETNEEMKVKTLETAFTVFQESRRVNDLRYCQFSFPAMFKCCGNLNPNGKHGHSIVDRVFRSCREEGKVGSLVLEHLRRACSEEHLKELLEVDDVSEESLEGGKHLPEEWIRNNAYRQAVRRRGGWSHRERQAYAKAKYG